MRLSEHFDEREFGWPRGATVAPAQRQQYRQLCETYLEPLRARFGRTTIVSGIRSATHNRQVGGAPHSFHVPEPGRRGVAADVVCAAGGPREWYELLDKLGAPGLGFYTTHVHVDNRAGRARW